MASQQKPYLRAVVVGFQFRAEGVLDMYMYIHIGLSRKEGGEGGGFLRPLWLHIQTTLYLKLLLIVATNFIDLAH